MMKSGKNLLLEYFYYNLCSKWKLQSNNLGSLNTDWQAFLMASDPSAIIYVGLYSRINIYLIRFLKLAKKNSYYYSDSDALIA